MPQALYRRYRPATFAEVIGQEHVTTPLRNALAGRRTHHAYLFSGPRGCGKTTSARILARCLNCDEGPTPDPCGQCQSCVELGPGGSGSLDVIEIDAASHGGVDDARDLRERAFFAPARSRYKVYIIDEAHMVSREGFNALLKLVEEPPDHVTFVFATTEPDKVIATIRSRTHHYPFRLVPPRELHAHLARVCEEEKVTVDPAVLSLVVRAGRGSVRDSLSVLDQLLAGAGEEGLTYAGAAALLGYTPSTLLDDTVDALAAGDAAAVFRIVDQVVEAGHDPRRFAEDLLERLRDLIIIDAVPDAAGNILGEHPADELERMREQAAHFGSAELSRAADVVNAGLTEMRGATAPRLLLELMCARALLPGADTDERGLAARLDRLERRLAIAGGPAARADVSAETSAAVGPGVSAETQERPSGGAPAETPTPPPASRVAGSGGPSTPSTPERHHSEGASAADTGGGAGDGEGGASAGAGMDLTTVRRLWPDVLDAVGRLKRTTWSFISQNAQVKGVDNGRLTLSFSTPGLRDVFLSRSDHQDYVREALIQVLGVDWQVEAIVDPSTAPTSAARSRPEAPGAPPAAAAGRPATTATGAAAGSPPEATAAGAVTNSGDDAPSADDEDADEGDLSHQDLLERELGARVIGEYDAS